MPVHITVPQPPNMAMEILYSAHRLRDLIAHKLDKLESSIKSMDDNLSEMCHYALAGTFSEKTDLGCVAHRWCNMEFYETLNYVKRERCSKDTLQIALYLCDLNRCTTCHHFSNETSKFNKKDYNIVTQQRIALCINNNIVTVA